MLNRQSWKKSGRRSIVSLTRVRRRLDHFRKEGAKLVPEPTAPDGYIEEAYRLWAIKQQGR